ncbi:MAG TPA: hypothetical protein ENN38_03580 [Actinobacteria bacterium]|nr:hypothetical protein [Actinomycetota bacterium]
MRKGFKLGVILGAGFIVLTVFAFLVIGCQKETRTISKATGKLTEAEALEKAEYFAGKGTVDLDILGSADLPTGEYFEIGDKDKTMLLHVNKDSGKVEMALLVDPYKRGNKDLTLEEAKAIALDFAKKEDIDFAKLTLTSASKNKKGDSCSEDGLGAKDGLCVFRWEEIAKDDIKLPHWVEIAVNYTTGEVVSVNTKDTPVTVSLDAKVTKEEALKKARGYIDFDVKKTETEIGV